MKFPKASEESRKRGWKIDFDFLAAIQDELTHKIGMDMIEHVLLAAQQVMQEQEKGFCEADYDPPQMVKVAFIAGIKWGQDNIYDDNPAHHLEALMEFWGRVL